ncbi:hypothetical protein Dimus_037638 [Dionaea muscipula]
MEGIRGEMVARMLLTLLLELLLILQQDLQLLVAKGNSGMLDYFFFVLGDLSELKEEIDEETTNETARMLLNMNNQRSKVFKNKNPLQIAEEGNWSAEKSERKGNATIEPRKSYS